MKEDKFDTLRQKDNALREALRQDEAELPQMSDDLNARLMKRMANEQRKPRRIVWPWIAAACAAAIMVVLMMPPKTSSPAPLAKEKKVVTPETHKVEKPMIAEVEMEAPQPIATPTKAKKAKVRTAVAKRNATLIAQETTVAEPVTPEVKTEEAPKMEMAQAPAPKTKPVTLTERDIPITRPENYKYTPEEIALLKKQADEAYLKWVELELEIAKHHLEQTAQQ
ncbi:MAG: hypothetical protein IJK43_11845 [Prevotella sp.]|nr:hypothetical protein [Prevotella sp.]